MAYEDKKLCGLKRFYMGLKVWRQNTVWKARILEVINKINCLCTEHTCTVWLLLHQKKIQYNDIGTDDSPQKGGYAFTIL